MSPVLCLSVLLAAVCLSWVTSSEYKAKVVSSLAHCAMDHKTNMAEAMNIVKSNKIPETQTEKCVAGCFFQRMGYITDLKVDWGKLKELNSLKYETPDSVAKANQVVDFCSKAVTTKASSNCDISAPAIKCLTEEADKVNLPQPDVTLI